MANQQWDEVKSDRSEDVTDRPEEKPSDKTDDQPHVLRVVELGLDGEGVVDDDEDE